MMKRKLGRSGLEVSALGMGCWAIGGPAARGESPIGWGKVNDEESVRALQRAFELGIDFYDTADVYGAGHSEKLIARALGDKRDQITIATKVGNTYVEETREAPGLNADPDYIRRACDESLRRLQTDRIDLYQFHIGDYTPEKAPEVLAVFEELVEAGKVRFFGWSTDDPQRAELFAQSPHCVAIQQAFNLFGGNDETLQVCEKYELASIIRGPLGMGILTGKFTSDTQLPPDDVRHGWNFAEGGHAEMLQKVDELRGVLTEGGRTLAQGALAWLWARSEATLPIPGFKTVQQVEENAGALNFGALSSQQMQRIDAILGRETAA